MPGHGIGEIISHRNAAFCESFIHSPLPSPPQPHTHTHTHVCSVVRSEAAATIGRWWLGVRNKRVFKILKEAICAAVRRFLLSVCTSITSQKLPFLWDVRQSAQGGCRWISYHMASLKCSVRNGLFKSSWCVELAGKALLEIMLLCLYSLWPRSIHWLEKSYANWVRLKLSF